jgi:hypothetical protein
VERSFSASTGEERTTSTSIGGGEDMVQSDGLYLLLRTVYVCYYIAFTVGGNHVRVSK